MSREELLMIALGMVAMVLVNLGLVFLVVKVVKFAWIG